DRSVVGVVVPAGYSFNLDGTAIYLAMATVFIAQATATPLGLTRQLGLLALLLITSKGAAGVCGAALVALAGPPAAPGHLPAVGDELSARCRHRADSRHPSLHGRGDGGDEPDRQRRRNDRRRQVVRPGAAARVRRRTLG